MKTEEKKVKVIPLHVHGIRHKRGGLLARPNGPVVKLIEKILKEKENDKIRS